VSKSGFVALAGRPNVGKSTFVNAVVGEKVAIVSDRSQTTRRAIRGICRRDDTEIIFVDLPGVQRPRDALTGRMARRVHQELTGADVALVLVSGEQGIGPGDHFIAQLLRAAAVPSMVAVNKVDLLSKQATVQVLAQAAGLEPSWEVFPISARTGAGLGELVEHLAKLMPEGPFAFDERATSDVPTELLLAELVREALIRRTFDELPHAAEVLVEELEWPRDGLARLRALIWVESESQKRIVIGAGGRMIKSIGQAARREIERELGAQVYLDLSVRVRPRWRADEGLLDRLGIG
jgi:GTP-binding protein Era